MIFTTTALKLDRFSEGYVTGGVTGGVTTMKSKELERGNLFTVLILFTALCSGHTRLAQTETARRVTGPVRTLAQTESCGAD
jgi:hypothetical protein